MKFLRQGLLITTLLFSSTTHASFIESTIGTAVVNDASATYNNPAALTLLKNPQIIALGTVANFHTEFSGQVTQHATGFTQTGSASATSRYYLPSFYFALPLNQRFIAGFGVIANEYNTDLEDNSILRYAQPNNNTQSLDFIPALAVKVTDNFSLGASLVFSYANVILQPIIGFPSLTIPDNQSRNVAYGTGVGGEAGFLLKLSKATLLGFNYHTGVTYELGGHSDFEGAPAISATNYHYTFWTPARSVLTMAHFVTPRTGFIATLQYIQWSVINNITFHNVATQIGSGSVILPTVTSLYHLHNSWAFTLGNIYQVTPKWVIRVAASYFQSPANPSYQISNGDSYIVGASMGYEFNKYFSLDGGYAHAFLQNENIHVTAGSNLINGVNKASRDAVSIRLLCNL